MSREKFVEHRFSQNSQILIVQANEILKEYAGQGYRLSLRQLYYQLVVRATIENSDRSYKRIGSLVSDARLAGLLDWNMIEDRNRETQVNSHWKSPMDILHAAAQSFQTDKWEDQPCHVEVMVEKDALSGILWPVCEKWDVRFTANKGYSSSSAMYEAAKRMSRMHDKGKDLVVLYLGDHDPSGIDMTRDITERLSLFTYNSPMTVRRLALNFDQVEVWNPPENPAKESDSRFETYRAEFGESSWELDAVEPGTLGELVADAIKDVVDMDLFDQAKASEEEMRARIQKLADGWKDEE